jgi:hypothetical protein
MTCSTGITVSAVVVIIGSVFTLLCGSMLLLASLFSHNSNHPPDAPVNLLYFLGIEAFVAFAFGGWGLASGIGLLKTKEWARISTLVYAAILVFISLPAAAVMAFVPIPNPPSVNGPNPQFNIVLMIRVGGTLLYAMFATLGGFWLYFFNTQKVKAQFRRQQPFTAAAQSEVPGLPSPTSGVRFGPDHHARPLSITIIGWYLVIASALGPLFIVFNSAFLPGLRLPFFFLGVFLFGTSAYLLLVIWTAVQIIAAVGLLKLKSSGLYTTIALQCLGLLNIVMIVAIPANRLRFQQIMDTVRFSATGHMYHSAPMVPMWIGLLGSLPLIAVILFFLISQKNAFSPPGSAPAPNISRQTLEITSSRTTH